MNGLNQTDLEELERRLLELKTELSEQLIIGEDASRVVTLDQTCVGRISRMDAMQQQSMAVSTRGKTTSRLRKVQTALQAMAEGEYGCCSACDETIALPRLSAQPEATLCLLCQDKADRQQ